MYHLNLSNNALGGAVPFDGAFLRRLGRNLDLSGNSGLCLDDRSVLRGVVSCRGDASGAGGGDASSAVRRVPGRGVLTRGSTSWDGFPFGLLSPACVLVLPLVFAPH
jgi:hypothetical protein